MLAWAATLTLCGAQPLGLTAGLLDAVAVQTGVAVERQLPALERALDSSTRARQFDLLRRLMADPLQMPRRIATVESELRAAADVPALLMATVGALYLEGVARQAMPRDADATLLRHADDPLVVAMEVLQARGSGARGPAFKPPAQQAGTRPLRLAVARVLVAIAHAEQLRRRALARLPTRLTPAMLLRQSVGQGERRGREPDYRRALTAIDRASLLDGMLALVGAVEALNGFLAHTPDLPAVAWQWNTALGQVLVDTTGRSTEHRLRNPLLVVDVGGDDTYVFEERSAGNRISVLLDRGGNDRYSALATASDPSAAMMGYGIVWDTEGDDRYEGTTMAQGAALFGMALHVDGGGRDLYEAAGFAQGFALGGVAVLLSSGGDDRFSGQTHAQASAGPEGVALLLDTAGDDHYLLGNVPLQWPSSQLPDRNVSMGQGAGRGLRADQDGGPAATGGIGLLLDLVGDDVYTAQVFAQGVGYYEGVGLLIDGAGRDVFEAAWYAMAAAAHHAVGALVNHGRDDDVYRASHSTSIGAAHDFSAAYFIDDGGDDRYTLGNLGLGAANDVGVAVFIDAGGDDGYEVGGAACFAFGAARLSEPDAVREAAPSLGLFVDLSGNDRYPAACMTARNGASWGSTARPGEPVVRGAVGIGWDTSHAP